MKTSASLPLVIQSLRPSRTNVSPSADHRTVVASRAAERRDAGGRGGRLEVADTAMIRAVVDVNVTGASLVAREAVRRWERGVGPNNDGTLGARGHLADILFARGRLDEAGALADDLARRGHPVQVGPSRMDLAGHAGVILVDASGVRVAGADPRSDGAAAGL